MISRPRRYDTIRGRAAEDDETNVSSPPSVSAQNIRGPQSADDVVIGLALTTTWVLATGRRLCCDVPLFHDLPAPELVDFWADDHRNGSATIP